MMMDAEGVHCAGVPGPVPGGAVLRLQLHQQADRVQLLQEPRLLSLQPELRRALHTRSAINPFLNWSVNSSQVVFFTLGTSYC